MLSVEQTSCIYCKRKTPEKILADKIIRNLPDNQAFEGKLRIVECRHCGFRYLNPRPALHDLSAIYNFDSYADSTNTNKFMQEYFLSLMRMYCKDLENVLEIGCGTGEFLSFLQKKGIAVSGVEFSDASGRVKFRGNLYIGRIEDIEIESDQFGAVCLLNVVEHLVDPLSTIKKINNILKKDGLLILRHPNSDMFFNVFYKSLVELPKYLYHRIRMFLGEKTKFTILGFINQHLFYFNYKTISKILIDSDFEIVFYSTKDSFNEYRMKQKYREKKYVESFIAFVRNAMSFFDLGPECIIVAKKKPLVP